MIKLIISSNDGIYTESFVSESPLSEDTVFSLTTDFREKYDYAGSIIYEIIITSNGVRN